MAQSKEELQSEKSKIEDDIKYTNKLLSETTKGKKASINQIYVIDKQISSRNKLIGNINKEIRTIDRGITSTTDSINMLNRELESLRDEYAEMILNTWYNKNAYKRLSYIFASKDLNQAFRRIAYFRYYSERRKAYCNDIIAKTDELQNKQDYLEKQRLNKRNLAQEQEKEKQVLGNEKQQKNAIVQKLTKEEKDLKKKIQKQQDALMKLNKAIAEAIAKEKKGSSKLELTPEEKIISDKFEGNKGKLPWPCERGIIIEKFGTHAHPDLKGIVINSTGITILTEANSSARAIFDGKVTKIIQIPQYDNVIIVRHGEYLSVYSNLSSVYVSVGDQVKTKQALGAIRSDNAEGTAQMHFEIWQDNTTQNPESWISGR